MHACSCLASGEMQCILTYIHACPHGHIYMFTQSCPSPSPKEHVAPPGTARAARARRGKRSRARAGRCAGQAARAGAAAGSPGPGGEMGGPPPEVVKHPDNRFCADCETREPRWASVNLGIFICETCAGIHRDMGTHISKVTSGVCRESNARKRFVRFAFASAPWQHVGLGDLGGPRLCLPLPAYLASLFNPCHAQHTPKIERRGVVSTPACGRSEV